MSDINPLLKPPPKILKRMGYFRDQSGIMNRYLRESIQWKGHLDKTREVILKWIHKILPEKIIVLGSGWLLDFPLDEAWQICRKIELIDINHPAQVLNRIKKYPGICASYMDLSGGMITSVYRGVKMNLSPEEINHLPAFPLPLSREMNNTLFISLNVMSQLDSLPVEYILEKTSIAYHELLLFRSGIQERHLEFLKSVNALLITDYAEVYQDFSNGSVSEKQILLTGPNRITPVEEWNWEFDSHGIYRKNCSTTMRVIAASF